ncbi:hypothetical protein LdCL_230015800 [Leishmania donovani]|uniref:Trypanosoma Tc-38 (p38) protein domain-containing protein n=1 Tax=Leishmania donovani TaxID=5661 RepID=A0A3S7WXS1_LEIDO|nr:hypothetical protein LdCL_230015800 [Leishmania donovani]
MFRIAVRRWCIFLLSCLSVHVHGHGVVRPTPHPKRRMCTHNYSYALSTCLHPLRERKEADEGFLLCLRRASVGYHSMLKHTYRVSVVFTQGFPALQRFAQQKFLPSNPLSSSCLWLDEEDFLAVKTRASFYNVPNPLRIDPYAHHPLLSRYAPEQARREAAVQRKGRRKAKDAAAARPVAAHGAGPQATNAADAEAPDHLLTTAEHEAVGHGAPSGPVLTGGNFGAGTQHSLEEATLPRRCRGRPPGSAAAAAQLAMQAQVAEHAPHYQVPICTLTLTKPLYLFNMDQMYLAEEGTAMSSLTAHCLGREMMDEYDSQRDKALTTWPPRKWRFAGGDGQLALAVNPQQPWDEPTPMFDEAASLTFFREHRTAEGVQKLQGRFPNSTSDHLCPQGRRHMYSISTRRPYSLPRQHTLNILAHRHGYRSQWWGTLKQWSNIGVLPKPGQTEHILPISVPSKIVHISLIEDAATVMQRCIILAKRCKLIYMFAAEAPVSLPESGGDAMGAHARQQTSFLSHLGDARHYGSEPGGFSRILTSALEDMRVKKWSLPVYFTLRQLRMLKLKLRPDAVGLLPTAAGAAEVHYIRDGAEAAGIWDGEVSAADGEAAKDATAPTATVSVDAASTEPRGGMTLSCCDATIATTQSTTTPAQASAGMLEYWYHLSQVYFPDSYLVPSVVLTAEFENPGVPLNGVSGQRLPYTALLYESLVNQHPEVAAVVRRASAADVERGTEDADLKESRKSAERRSCVDAQGAVPVQQGLGRNQDIARSCASAAAHTFDSSEIEVDEEDLAIARFVATHSSPKHTQGRSLWYQAQDVLAAGGVVDVNSAPVEVMKKSAALWMGLTQAGGSGVLECGSLDKLPGNVLCNVECLMNPDEALRLISAPFDPM